MWKKIALLIGALALGLLSGWWLRGKVAVDTCLDMGGQWLQPGLCYNATDYLFQ